ncbi:MAG: type II secretion system minor pseudopilin GspK [Candidatus Binataceae bacterium]
MDSAQPKLPAMRRAAARSQRGVALLATMMAVTLLTVLILDFTTATSISYRSTANQANQLRAYYLARSGVQVGIAMMAADVRQSALSNTPRVDSLQSMWALPLPPLPVDGGWASLSIVDEARKLNINQLVGPNGQVNQPFAQTLGTLFTVLGIDPTTVIPSLIDWLDPDSVDTPGGAESDYYLRLVPPYEARNGPMPTIGDLRLIRGINEAAFMRLKNFITTTPSVRVNINTAPPEVLMAVAPQLAQAPSALNSILAARTEHPFNNMTEVSELPGVSNLSTPLPATFSTTSDYFTVTGLGSFAGTRTYVYATIRRTGPGPQLLLSWNED